MPEVKISWEELRLLEGVREQVKQASQTLTLSGPDRALAQQALTKLVEPVQINTDAPVSNPIPWPDR